MDESEKTERFVQTLISWGSQNRRRFAWRETRDPYRILVAELLLQRTKADQVEPIYLKFLERFPDPRSLAAASVEEVDSAIRHLGLAYRAARIRSAARSLVEQYGGVVPAGVNALKRLAVGIGDYIAHAVMCFGFGQNVPVVDANVARIVRRVFSLSFGSSPHKSPILWDFVRKILPEGAAREFNWAIIDFGSLVCTPKEPLCRRCPMNRFCDYGSAVLAGRPPPAVQRASNLGLRRARHQ